MLKMLKSKKATSLLLALIMIFALSTTAFAANTVTLTVNIAGQPSHIYTGLAINAGDTVYDVADSVLGASATWIDTPVDPLYSPLRNNPNAVAKILTELDGKESKVYVPGSAVEEWEDYIVGSDPVLDGLHYQYLAEYGGIAMWIGDGMAIMGDWEHMMYVGYDWTYTVNGQVPGIGITPDGQHPYDFFQYYMNESFVEASDAILLTYGINGTVF